MNRVRIFSENLRLSGLQILFGLPVLPSASALMSSPASRALVSTGIHSLLMAAPAVSFWPPRRFSAITAPALSCLGMDTPLPATFSASPATMDFSQFCRAE